jgi:hypothetical protein
MVNVRAMRLVKSDKVRHVNEVTPAVTHNSDKILYKILLKVIDQSATRNLPLPITETREMTTETQIPIVLKRHTKKRRRHLTRNNLGDIRSRVPTLEDLPDEATVKTNRTPSIR